MTVVLLAVPGLAQEPDLVVAAPARGLQVRRRCVDAVDLLAAAATDPEATVVVSASLPRLSADAVERMAVGGRRVVGLAAGTSDADVLRALGVVDVVLVGPTPAATARAARCRLCRHGERAGVADGRVAHGRVVAHGSRAAGGDVARSRAP